MTGTADEVSYMPTVRAFVAIDPGARLREWVGGALGRLAQRYRTVRWVRPESIHLTLRFLGDIETPQVADILGALESSCAAEPVPEALESVCLDLGESGSFGRRSAPTVCWIGLRPSPSVEYVCRLQYVLERAVRRLGFEAERRRWTPHLTLGRNRSREDLAGWEPCVGLVDGDAPSMMVEEIGLYSSELWPSGAKYNRLGEVRLQRRREVRPN